MNKNNLVLKNIECLGYEIKVFIFWFVIVYFLKEWLIFYYVYLYLYCGLLVFYNLYFFIVYKLVYILYKLV